ncbi:putative cytochrome p450 family protein [Botrytis fragariae]|uniref:Putative cytochrome p450 family protein n=1 Tax=Botrytis fragariae TaxID=1964551 RepID=A0A8H6ATQ3_9HELO|nr:putative cytochrome p450 family protein [Botrytis fragariae]KAF5873426.1 putative cytochrome p450 family protein [Botrytis fragariae]
MGLSERFTEEMSTFESFAGIPSYLVILQIIFSTFFLKLFLTAIYRITFHPFAKYPGPRWAKITDLYSAYHSLRGTLQIRTLQAHDKYGSVVRLGPNKLVFNSAEALQEIYSSKNVQKSKGYAALVTTPGVHNVHNAVDFSVHKHKRRVLSKGFSIPSLLAFEPTMISTVNLLIKNLAKASIKSESQDRWSTPINMGTSFKHMSLDVMGEFGFGQSFNLQTSSDNHFLSGMVAGISTRGGVLLQCQAFQKIRIERFFYRKVHTAVMRYYSTVSKLVADRLKEDKNSKKDLFAFIFDAQYSNNGKHEDIETMTVSELFTESGFLLAAGSDTSSTTLSALLFYLSRYPKCYEKVATEIRSTFSSLSEIHSGPEITSLKYLRACIEEALRMSPPLGSALWREVRPGGITIDGELVPAGYDIGCAVYAVQHNERYFRNSFEFQPERWIVSEDSPQEKIEEMKMAFAPFSLGPRGCPGKTMAYMEMGLMMSRMIFCFDFRRPRDGGLGEVGEGVVGDMGGRERVNEFQLMDHLASTHVGPYAEFRLRDGLESVFEGL